MGFFDFHHHDAGKNLGIYNLKFNEIPPENYFSAGIHPNAVADDFEEKLKQNPKLFIFCNPHNPLGHVWTFEELKSVPEYTDKINRVLKRYN